jgi:hypothetical protein
MGFDRRATIHEPGNARFSWPMNYYAICVLKSAVSRSTPIVARTKNSTFSEPAAP